VSSSLVETEKDKYESTCRWNNVERSLRSRSRLLVLRAVVTRAYAFGLWVIGIPTNTNTASSNIYTCMRPAQKIVACPRRATLEI